MYRQQQVGGGLGGGGGGFKREPSFGGYPSGDDRLAEEDLGNGSGMEEYDRY